MGKEVVVPTFIISDCVKRERFKWCKNYHFNEVIFFNHFFELEMEETGIVYGFVYTRFT